MDQTILSTGWFDFPRYDVAVSERNGAPEIYWGDEPGRGGWQSGSTACMGPAIQRMFARRSQAWASVGKRGQALNSRSAHISTLSQLKFASSDLEKLGFFDGLKAVEQTIQLAAVNAQGARRAGFVPLMFGQHFEHVRFGDVIQRIAWG